MPKDASAGKQDGGAKLFRNISKFDLAEEAKSAIAKIAANNSGRVIESFAPGRDITSAGPLAEIGHLIAEKPGEITPAPAGASS